MRRPRAGAAAAGLAADLCFSSLEEALDRTGCHAIVAATPAQDHEVTCRSALARGLSILVEKPFTTSLTAAIEIVREAEARGVAVVVAQNFRYLRGLRAARRLVASGDLGQIGMVTFQYFHGRHHMAPSLTTSRDNVLWGVGVHHLDAMRVIIGQKPVGVSARTFTLPWTNLPHGASLQSILEFDGGTRAVYTATYESNGHEYFERGQEFYGRIVGERATLHIFHRWLLLCRRNRLPVPIWRGSRPVTEERVLLGQLERAMLHGETADASGRDNLQTMAMVEACLQSAASGNWTRPQELLT